MGLDPRLRGRSVNRYGGGMSRTMRAMQQDEAGKKLRAVGRPIPAPGTGELLIEISACGICRTDLHIADGDLKGPLRIVLGHEIVGRLAGLGEGINGWAVGDR